MIIIIVIMRGDAGCLQLGACLTAQLSVFLHRVIG